MGLHPRIISWSFNDHENGEESAQNYTVGSCQWSQGSWDYSHQEIIGYTHWWSARKVPLPKAHVLARLKFANDWEENGESVVVRWDQNPALWYPLNSPCLERRNAAYDPKIPSPPSNMEVETLCFRGVFLLRGQDNCTASKGWWTVPCAVRARALKLVVDGYSSMTWAKTHSQGNKGSGLNTRRDDVEHKACARPQEKQ